MTARASFDAPAIGGRVRRLRLVAGLGQVEFADRVGIANGSVSKLENGRMPISANLLAELARALDCTPEFLAAPSESLLTTRPWLRAYADASKRAVDRQIAEAALVAEVVEGLHLPTIPDSIPTFHGDGNDDAAVEDFAQQVRLAAGLDEGDVVGHAIRAAERLGCIVLPMRQEMGRHLGMSVRVSLLPLISVSREVPGDRQRFTVAHEIGHLALHAELPPPDNARAAQQIERQAHLLAGAFLAPAEPLVDDLNDHGGRVTLRTLETLKAKWGLAIKALVVRFRSLGVIDEDHARSLYKQISARGWNKHEPVEVGTEQAIWLRKALERSTGPSGDALSAAATRTGLGRSHFERWTSWTTQPDRSSSGPSNDSVVVPIESARRSGRREVVKRR